MEFSTVGEIFKEESTKVPSKSATKALNLFILAERIGLDQFRPYG